MTRSEYQRAYRLAHKEELAAKKRAYVLANREKTAAQVKAWREANTEHLRKYRNTPEAKERNRLAMRKRAPELVRAYANKTYAKRRAKQIADGLAQRKIHTPQQLLEIKRAASRAWKKANPGLASAALAERRARLRQQLPKWADRAAMKAIYVEARRVSRETGVDHDVDHIVPIRGRTVSGLHVPHNLRVIPSLLNQQKCNKLLEVACA